MRYKRLWIGFVLALAAAAGAGLAAKLAAGSKNPKPDVVHIRVSSNDSTLVANSPAPGQLRFRAEWPYTNIVRDAFYVYAVTVLDMNAGGAPVWEHVYDEPVHMQGANKGQPLVIKLPEQQIEVVPGFYAVQIEIREDVRVRHRNGNLVSPYMVVHARALDVVEVK